MENNETQANTATKTCPFCMEQINAEAKKCKHCGEILDVVMREMENLKRNQSNQQLVINNNNNNNNGNGNRPAPPPMAPPKSRLAYCLLALFFGTIGIHNFYAGHGGRGIAQLLITLLSAGCLAPVVFIWAVIEMLVVTEDGRGVPFN